MKRKSEQEPWLEELQQKLENYSEQPQANGWDRLEKDFFAPQRRVIRPIGRWWSIASAAALLTAVSAVAVYFLQSPEADDLRTASTLLPETGAPQNPTFAQTEQKTAYTKRQTAAKPADMGQHRPAIKGNIQATTEKAQVAEETASPLNASTSDRTRQTEPTSDASNRPKETEKRSPYNNPVPEDLVASARIPKGWSVSATIGNGGIMAAAQAGRTPMANTPSYLLETTVENGMTSITEDETVYINDLGYPEIRRNNQILNIKHHQPVTVGLTFRKELPKNCSVETGITYTLLSSDVMLTGMQETTSQKLHYIGIPIRANWTFMDRDIFSLYVSAGGSIEKCVGGKLANRDVKEKPMQYSVLGALGAQINLTQHFGIYVEPGISYFFDDGSKLITIRKENPCNFNLQTGLRFSY